MTYCHNANHQLSDWLENVIVSNSEKELTKTAGKKVIITLDKPKDAESKKVFNIIKKHVDAGGKFNEIELKFDFITNDIKGMVSRVRKIYNNLAFQRDKK